MQRIRLWTASLASRVDGMVSRIENHEALAESALRDVRRAAARARVQLRRVREDGARLRDALAAERLAVQQWEERATRTAAEDRARALECMRRRQQAARRAALLSERAAEHERVERQLAADVARVEERLAHLEEQRNLLASRETRARALGVVREARWPAGADVDEVFGRWEERVAEDEILGRCTTGDDGFALDFSEEEEAGALDEALEALLARRGREED